MKDLIIYRYRANPQEMCANPKTCCWLANNYNRFTEDWENGLLQWEITITLLMLAGF